MTKIYIIYAEKQYIGVLIVTDAPDKAAAEREIDQIIEAGGSIHKVISGEELGLDVTVTSDLVYPDEMEEV